MAEYHGLFSPIRRQHRAYGGRTEAKRRQNRNLIETESKSESEAERKQNGDLTKSEAKKVTSSQRRRNEALLSPHGVVSHTPRVCYQGSHGIEPRKVINGDKTGLIKTVAKRTSPKRRRNGVHQNGDEIFSPKRRQKSLH